jgi:hypothetical protein
MKLLSYEIQTKESAEVVMYISKTLEPFVERNHVAICEGVQRLDQQEHVCKCSFSNKQSNMWLL